MRDIAHQLDISVKAVEAHKGNLSRKLGVRTSSDLVKFALMHGRSGARA